VLLRRERQRTRNEPDYFTTSTERVRLNCVHAFNATG
jgi:hypothetical protein